MKRKRHDDKRRVLGRVRRDEFAGRAAELEKLVTMATRPGEGRGLLILLAPLSGVSELLRQTYDELFNLQSDVVPIYFSLPASETTAVSAAIEYLNTFLHQYVAFRRDEPALSQAPLTLNDIVQLAPAADLDWIKELVDSFDKQRFGSDDRELVRFCLNVSRWVGPRAGRPFVMFDAVQLATYEDSTVLFATELIRALMSADRPFALAGLRREIVTALERAGGNLDSLDKIHLERLEEEDARKLVSSAADALQVTINDETRDLLIQQLEGSPFFIMAMLRAAREKHVALDSYLACERVYVDELLGGKLNRYFDAVLERIAPDPDTRRLLVSLLCEGLPAGNRTASFAGWRKRLALDSLAVEHVLARLHAEELINWDGETVNTAEAAIAWQDFLRSRFRLDSLREPRALVVADLMATALKRAPQTVARHYRRLAAMPLRELLNRFNYQRVPSSLFYSDLYAQLYKGATREEIATGLEGDTDLVQLPQIFHTATGPSFSSELRQLGEEVSVVAHGFEGTTFTDANEIVWLVARVASKLEADTEVTEFWLSLLDDLARRSGFVRTRIWLVGSEGFTGDAAKLLRKRNAYFSSQEQFEILAARLSDVETARQPLAKRDEVELVIPMGADFELLAANTVEQIARRLHFTLEATNQIKTAIVEACINASEHSLSPDRKIYQRFLVEDDKLVITIGSRGLVPTNLSAPDREQQAREAEKDQRRGWGLKLIRTLMDEVDFERVDEGTSLRMTKYLRES